MDKLFVRSFVVSLLLILAIFACTRRGTEENQRLDSRARDTATIGKETTPASATGPNASSEIPVRPPGTVATDASTHLNEQAPGAGTTTAPMSAAPDSAGASFETGDTAVIDLYATGTAMEFTETVAAPTTGTLASTDAGIVTSTHT